MRTLKDLLGRELVALLLALGLGAGAAQAQELCIAAPTGMVGWWTGDDNTSDLIADADGTLINGATFTPAGQVDEAFLFDGIDDYVSVPDTPALSLTTAMTLSAWVRSDGATSSLQTIVAKPREVGGTGYALSLFPDGRPDMALNNGFNCAVVSPVPVVRGEWAHVAGTWDVATSAMKIYLNGQLQATNVSCATGAIQDSSHPLEIGRESVISGGRHFKGGIDEVQVYNRALTAQEIQNLYTAGTEGTCKAALLLSRLQNFFVAADIDPGVKNALLQKLDNAAQSYDEGNFEAAENQLSALMNQTEAQTGQKISPEDAADIIAAVEEIIALLGEAPETPDCPCNDPSVSIAFYETVASHTFLAQCRTFGDGTELLTDPYDFVFAYESFRGIGLVCGPTNEAAELPISQEQLQVCSALLRQEAASQGIICF